MNEKESIEATHFAVHPDTIVPNTLTSFVLFMKDGDNLTQIGGPDKEISSEIRQTVRDRGIDSFYVQNRDRSYYQLYVEEILGDILADSEISVEVRAKTAYDVILAAAEPLFTSPKPALMARYRQMATEIVAFVIKEPGAIRGLINQTSFDFALYHHSVNVGIYSLGLAKELFGDDPAHDMVEIAVGFFLHDIGKTSISLDILNKKGPLSPVDWKLMRRHPEEGAEILYKFNQLTDEAQAIVLQHHERDDGSGYPKGLKDKQIHVYARICAIADSFDALTAYRPYRKEHSTFNALKIMKQDMFKDFDPIFFQKFLQLFASNE